MAKRRLTQQQKRTIAQRHKAHLEDSHSQATFEALVIKHLGKQAVIETEDGEALICFIRQNLGSIVTGDRVIATQNIANETVIVARAERESLLYRPDLYKQQKDIAANLTQLGIVVAKIPEFISYYLDQYLVAAAFFNIPTVIIVNKIDLLNDDDLSQEMRNQLIYYHNRLNYPIIYCSADTGQNLEALELQFKHKCSVVMGLSGVGKSSIVNALFKTEKTRVDEVSEATLKGQHTTTTACLYHLPSGGDLIDSPGIREFGIWHFSRTDIFKGYRELDDVLGTCKFRDCQHDQEPGCAVRTLLKDEKKMAPFRHDNLMRMLNNLKSPS